jgi:DNA polymerase-3 subunit gamma/tau
MWQMLLKALEEVAAAPNSMMAAEMAVIRLTHVADLPSPEDLMRKLRDTPRPPQGGGQSAPSGSGGGATARSAQATRMQGSSTQAVSNGAGQATAQQLAPQDHLARYGRFEDVVDLIRAHRDVKLLIEVETMVQLANYAPGRIEFVPTDSAPADLAARLSNKLQIWTGARWGVTLVNEGGAQTIAAVRDADELALKAEAEAHPLMQAVLHAFPNAKISEIRTRKALAEQAAAQALPEVDEEWDPFEEE